MIIRIIIAALFLCCAAISTALAGTPKITGISPIIVVPGDIVTISVEDFGKDITLTLKAGESANQEILSISPVKKDNKHYEVTVPMLRGGSSKATISMTSDKLDVKPVNDKAGNPIPLDIYIYSNTYIREAVLWKSMPQSATLEHIATLMQRSTDDGRNSDALFHGVPIIGGDLQALKDAGYDADFIQKLEGQKQYLSIGMTGILLTKANDLVAAPMLRIFIQPRCYFRQRVPFWSLDYSPLKWVQGFLERTDFNFGYTVVKTKVDKDSTTTVETNFMLAGLSYEINKAALFNAGWALPVNSGVKEKGQIYVGITVDSNLLKELKILEK